MVIGNFFFEKKKKTNPSLRFKIQRAKPSYHNLILLFIWNMFKINVSSSIRYILNNTRKLLNTDKNTD
jgi:hypothetical protein